VVFLLPMVASGALPASSQQFTPYTDSKTVLAHVNPILEQLRQFFAFACARANEHFVARGWTRDANLFAYEVRKDVFEKLKALGADISETDDTDSTAFTLERMALSGLLLKLPGIHLRIRKSKDNDIPAAGSDQLLSFYNWNLFAFDDADQIEDPAPLHLVLLWNTDADWKVSTFWLVCPRGERAGEVRWYWQEAVPPAVIEAREQGQEFRTAFQQANSDVPLAPKVKDPRRIHASDLATGTDTKTK
jgi:hypothetical protein